MVVHQLGHGGRDAAAEVVIGGVVIVAVVGTRVALRPSGFDERSDADVGNSLLAEDADFIRRSAHPTHQVLPLRLGGGQRLCVKLLRGGVVSLRDPLAQVANDQGGERVLIRRLVVPSVGEGDDRFDQIIGRYDDEARGTQVGEVVDRLAAVACERLDACDASAKLDAERFDIVREPAGDDLPGFVRCGDSGLDVGCGEEKQEQKEKNYNTVARETMCAHEMPASLPPRALPPSRELHSSKLVHRAPTGLQFSWLPTEQL